MVDTYFRGTETLLRLFLYDENGEYIYPDTAYPELGADGLTHSCIRSDKPVTLPEGIDEVSKEVGSAVCGVWAGE
jgi:hypothetical protein